MSLNPLVLGIGPVILALVAGCCAVLGFPVYFWVADKRRRGEPVALKGLVLPLLVGVAGVVATLLFLFARG